MAVRSRCPSRMKMSHSRRVRVNGVCRVTNTTGHCQVLVSSTGLPFRCCSESGSLSGRGPNLSGFSERLSRMEKCWRRLKRARSPPQDCGTQTNNSAAWQLLMLPSTAEPGSDFTRILLLKSSEIRSRKASCFSGTRCWAARVYSTTQTGIQSKLL